LVVFIDEYGKSVLRGDIMNKQYFRIGIIGFSIFSLVVIISIFMTFDKSNQVENISMGELVYELEHYNGDPEELFNEKFLNREVTWVINVE